MKYKHHHDGKTHASTNTQLGIGFSQKGGKAPNQGLQPNPIQFPKGTACEKDASSGNARATLKGGQVGEAQAKGAAHPPRRGWIPISLLEAQILWAELGAASKRLLERFRDTLEHLWVVGQCGGEPVAVVIGKRAEIGIMCAEWCSLPCETLPLVSYCAGARSVLGVLEPFLELAGTQFRFHGADVGELREALGSLFLEQATRARPERRAVPALDGAKPNLSVRGATALAENAFATATRAARVHGKPGFADGWALHALAYVCGKDADTSLLAPQGTALLNRIRGANIFKSRNDLIAQQRTIRALIQGETRLLERAKVGLTKREEPYLAARRSSAEGLLCALERGLSGRAINYRPFSQQFIRGVILAKAARAQLCAGQLSDCVSEELAIEYGEALPQMQDARVFLTGRPVEELRHDVSGGPGVGIFRVQNTQKRVLAVPEICLRADYVVLDPRPIFHEFDHARQDMACEGSLRREALGSHQSELEAVRAELREISEFGVLF